MNGLILIDKPKNYTSFDVVAIMRKLCKQKKVGHTGTLDPVATGVLPILIGNATKAQSLIPNHDKEYIAKFRLGVITDTQDVTGNIISNKKFNVAKKDLINVLEEFKGEIFQVPPMYSAIKKDGKKLYELARLGMEVERAARKVKIYSLFLVAFNDITGEGELRVGCSEGTYIRTLCNDIGNRLGCGAVMTELRRTFACGFSIDNCITIDEARQMSQNNALSTKFISTDNLFNIYDAISITTNQSIRFKNGGCLDLSRISISNMVNDGAIFRVYNPESIFIGLGKVSKEFNSLLIYKLFLN